MFMFICKYEYAKAAYHVFETKIVMYEHEIAPHVSLADIGVTFHNKIPLRSGAQICQNVRAKQDCGYEIWRESEEQDKKINLN